jgi:hypothetical protein
MIKIIMKLWFIVAELELLALQINVCIHVSINANVLNIQLLINNKTCLIIKRNVIIPVIG